MGRAAWVARSPQRTFLITPAPSNVWSESELTIFMSHRNMVSTMERRYLASSIAATAFASHKMAFVSGPRQAGKTTLGKMLLAERSTGRYATWDDIETRRLWVKDPKLLVPAPSGGSSARRRAASPARPLLVLDEIHKARLWKRSVKGLWDVRGDGLDVLVTGSARLNVYRKGSDSLVGRYYHLRLHPFSVREMLHLPPSSPDDALAGLLSRSRRATTRGAEILDALERFGGFPEPFLAASDRRARLWQRTRIERVIREDLRDLSRLPELSSIEMLSTLLPERVGSRLSVASLQRDLEVAHDTVSRWLGWLRDLYYIYELKPWQQRIARSLRKDGKAYLFDWSEVDDVGARFENLVASHLLKAVDFWTDTGEGTFSLSYLRDKQKREIDFLIVRDRKPWLAIEAKRGDTSLAPAWRTFLPRVGCNVGIQIVRTPGQWTWHDIDGARVLVASASEVLAHLV